jgi:hypothetical protein
MPAHRWRAHLRTRCAATAASSSFTWLRQQGFQRLNDVLEAGLEQDTAALGQALDATYSQSGCARSLAAVGCTILLLLLLLPTLGPR